VSRLLWKQALLPSPAQPPAPISYELYAGELRLPRAIAFPAQDKDLVTLPQPRVYRSLSRAGLLLNAVGLGSRDALAPFLAADPFSVGVYCGIEHGPDDFHCARQMAAGRPEEFAATYRSLRSPKQHFKQLPSVPACQLSIFLGIHGPLNVYNHSRFAALHALNQAEFDLNHGRVAAALVCSAFSVEHPLLALRTWRHAPPGAVLCEGAATLLLVCDGSYTDWRNMPRRSGERYFGVADALIGLASEEIARPAASLSRTAMASAAVLSSG